jgi:methionine-rich copper-binding protein CopC
MSHRTLALMTAVAALLIGTAAPAQAHDVLVSTSPADGSSTAVAPGKVVLTFSEPALGVGSVVVVTGPAGPAQAGAAVVVAKTVSQQLRPGSPAGRYRVVWRVSSADGHPVSGQFSFTARAPSPGQQATATSASAVAATGTATPLTARVPAGASTPASPDSATSATSPAPTGGQTSIAWRVVGAGVVMLLLLAAAGFRLTRKPRSTPDGERDLTS